MKASPSRDSQATKNGKPATIKLDDDQFWNRYQAALTEIQSLENSRSLASISAVIDRQMWNTLDAPRRERANPFDLSKIRDIGLQLYTAGSPNTLWYCNKIENTVLGIASSSKYVAFVKVVGLYKPRLDSPGGTKPGNRETYKSIHCVWYGVVTMEGVRKCIYDRSTKTICFPLNPGHGRSKSPRVALPVDYRIPAMYIAKEGGLHLSTTSEAGRRLAGTPECALKSDKEWKSAYFGVENIFIETENYYCVPCSCIDLHHPLDPEEHIIPNETRSLPTCHS